MKILRELVPLNTLSEARFAEISGKIIIEEVRAGSYLFRIDDRDKQTVYLLGGEVTLLDGKREVSDTIRADSNRGRFPIADAQPRVLSARAVKKCVVARVDSSLLDAFLSWDQSNNAEAVAISANEDADWMTRMLQSKAFEKIPPEMIQQLLLRMDAVEFKAGTTVIRQGDHGDCFYTIKNGKCTVTLRDSPQAEERVLAELSDGDCFGEEALVQDVKRNATVTMTTNGVLMRLAKQDFVELLQKPLIRYVDYEMAAVMVDEGAIWVDVRTVDEYASNPLYDSVNIPLSTVRGEMPDLVFNVVYIIYCDTGKRSSSAAFILSHKGFDVYVLQDGLQAVPCNTLDPAEERVPVEPDVEAGVAGLEQQDMTLQDQNQKLEAGLAAAHEQQAALELQVDELKRLHEQDRQQLAGNTVEHERSLAALQADTGPLEVRVSEQVKEIDRLLADKQSVAETLDRKNQEWEEERALVVSGTNEAGQRVTELQDHLRQAQEKHDHDKSVLQQKLDSLVNETDSKLKNREVEFDEISQCHSSLLGDLEAAHKESVSLQKKCDDLGAQIASVTGSADEQLKELQVQLEAGKKQHEKLEQQSVGQLAQLHLSQDEVTGLKTSEEKLEQELESLRKDKHELQQVLERHDEQELVMQKEHEAALVDAREGLARTTDIEQELRDQVEQLQQLLEESKSDLQDQEQQLDSGQAAAHEQHTSLELQIDELRKAHEQEQQQLAKSVEDHEHAATKMQGESRRLERSISKQEEQIANLLADKQAVAEVQDRQITQWDEARSLLESGNDEAQRRVAELQEQVEQAVERNRLDKLQMQENMDVLVNKTNGKIERREIECVELKQCQSRLKGDLEIAQKECDSLNRKLGAAVDNDTGQQQKIDALDVQVVSLTESAGEQSQALQDKLDARQLQLEDMQQQAADRLAMLNGMQDEMAGMKAVEEGREEEMTGLRQQKEELQQVLVQRDEQTGFLRQEHQQALARVHEDLTRKNDIERELQIQVDRLQRKLEQTKSKYRETSEGAQADIDCVREDLHAERSARSAERAEMAARQRELKEKLAVVATEHEANLSNQSGAIEQARIAGREEDHVQLEKMRVIQRETDTQLEKLQNELSQAHGEITELVKREKSRRCEEHDLSDERKQEFEASVGQLRTQTEQLVQERDIALRDQAVLREEMNSLRAEVDVARGLMGGGKGQVEDPLKLRRELDESRKNVEIAVRLRVETESAYSRLKEERDALQKQVGNKLILGEPLNSPAPGSEESRDTRSVFTARPVSATPVPTATRKAQSVFSVNWRRLARILGFGVIAIAGLNYGLKHYADGRIMLVSQLQDNSVAPVSTKPASSGVSNPGPGTNKKVSVPPAVETVQPVVPAPESQQQRLPAMATFRDRLKEDGFSPRMVKLPSAEFVMGSQGHMLNFTEGPQHEVRLRRFAISKHEVTFNDYDRFARATGARLPHDETWGRGNRPVINVSWKDAQAYVSWLSDQTGYTYRLPAEAQWEYAARAGVDARSSRQSGSEAVNANCFDCGSEWDQKGTAPVGSFTANNFGLHDMAGNVQEWTQDCYRAGYGGAPEDGSPLQISGCTQQAVRGGAYTSPLTSLRSASRAQYDQDTRLDNLGFRIVRSY